jgi:ABC-type glycerol-3-phosphate transport system substrate-binding protein
MKRLLSMAICVVLFIVFVIGGCTTAEKTGTVEEKIEAAQTEKKAESAPTAAPVQTEPVLILQDEVSADGAEASDNAKVKAYIEDQSGVKFEITQVKSEDELMTKINLTLASNEKIDIIRVSNSHFYGIYSQRRINETK